MATATPLPAPALALVRDLPAHPYRAPAQELTVTDVAALSRGLEKIDDKLDRMADTLTKLAIDSRGNELRVQAAIDALDVHRTEDATRYREREAYEQRTDTRLAVLEQATAGHGGVGRALQWIVPIVISLIAAALALRH